MSSNQPPAGPPDEPTRHADQPQGPPSDPSQPDPNPHGPPQQGGPHYGPPQGNPYGQPHEGGQPNYGQPNYGPPNYGQPPQGNPYGPPQQGSHQGGPQPGYGQPNPSGYGQAYPGGHQGGPHYAQSGPYGQPQAGAYGQPAPGAPPYGTAQHGGYQQPGGSGNSKVWLIVVLVIVLLIALAGLVIGIVSLTGDDESGTAVNDLEAGQCVTSEDIAEGDASIDSIETTACDTAHDGEVFATIALTQETAQDFDINAAGSLCVDELAESTGLTLEVLSSAGREVRPLVADSEPTADDTIVCFIRHSSGEKLTEKIAE